MVPAEVRNKRDPSLGDALAMGMQLWVRCLGCSHAATMHPAALAQLVGYDCSLSKLDRRLRCRRCNEKRVRVRAVQQGEPR